MKLVVFPTTMANVTLPAYVPRTRLPLRLYLEAGTTRLDEPPPSTLPDDV